MEKDNKQETKNQVKKQTQSKPNVAKTEAEKAKEKERLAKEKEKAKEKERLAKEKEKAKEKERLAKEKEKAKEKERLAKEKEKEKAKKAPKKPVILAPKEGIEAKVLVSRDAKKLEEKEEPKKVALSEEVDESELKKIKENETKESLSKMQSILEARQKLNSGVEPKETSNKSNKLKLGKISLDDENDSSENESSEMQALKSRSFAQKELESELINKKGNEMQEKLLQASKEFGPFDQDETRGKSDSSDALMMQIEELEENNEMLNDALDRAENLEYNGIKVCNPDTFELSEEFKNYLDSMSAKEINVMYDNFLVCDPKSLEITPEFNAYIEELKKNNQTEKVIELENIISSLKQELELTKKDNEKLNDENKNSKVQIDKLTADLSNSKTQSDVEEEVKKVKEEYQEKIIVLNNSNTILKSKNEKMTADLEALQNQLNDANANQQNIAQELSESKSEIEKLTETINQLNTSNDTLNNDLNSLYTVEYNNIMVFDKENNSLSEEFKNYVNKLISESSKEKVNELESQIQVLTIKLNESKSQPEESKEEFKVTVEEVVEPSSEAEENDVVEEKPSVEKKHFWKNVGEFFISSFNGMAYGLFATLIIGVILSQIATIFPEGNIVRDSLTSISTGLKLLMGVGIGIGIARGLKLEGIKLLAVSVAGGICAYLQNPGGFGANADPLSIYVIVILTYLVIKYVWFKSTPVDVIFVPLIATIISGVLTLLCADYIKMLTTGIGEFINKATELQPLAFGIIISVVMGMCLTAPISSAAIAISIGLNGLAAGAAAVGCCVQMLGFAIMSRKDNNVGKVISVGIGTSMLQFKNILKKPIIWLPTIIVSAILGPIATCVLKLQCTPVGAGMGTSGLIGVIQTFEAMGYDLISIFYAVGILIVAPILLVWLVDIIFRKLKWIKKGDLEI